LKNQEKSKKNVNLLYPASPAAHNKSTDEITRNKQAFSTSSNGASPAPHHLKQNLNPKKGSSLRNSSVNSNNISAGSSTTPSTSINQPSIYNSYQVKQLPDEQ